MYLDNVSIAIKGVISTKYGIVKKNQSSVISFSTINKQPVLILSLKNPQTAQLKIFDLKGKLITDISSSLNALTKGTHRVMLPKNLAKGVYCIDFRDNAVSTRTIFSLTQR